MKRDYCFTVQGVKAKVAMLAGQTRDTNDPLSVYIDKEGNVYVCNSENLSAMVQVTKAGAGVGISSHKGPLGTIPPLSPGEEDCHHMF